MSELLGTGLGRGRLVRHDLALDLAAALTATHAIDARVAHEGDEPSGDTAARFDVLLGALGQGHEGVVHGVLRLGAIAQDAEREGEEDGRVPVVQRTYGLAVALGYRADEIRIRHAIHARRLVAASWGVKLRGGGGRRFEGRPIREFELRVASKKGFAPYGQRSARLGEGSETYVDQEHLLAELLALVAAGRVDRLVDVAVADVPEAARPEVRATGEAFAAIALGEPAEAPSPALRDRVMTSVGAKLAAKRAPRRALLVLDMLNDHLTPGRPLEVPRAREIVPAVAARIEAARREGTPVVYVCDAHEPSDADLDDWRVHNVKGSAGAEVWPPLAPKANDRVVHKPTYSGFVRSSLSEVLGELKVDTLVLTGCLTEIGMMATATDALQRGYAVEIPPDAQAGVSEATERTTLGILRVMTPYGEARRELLARLTG